MAKKIYRTAQGKQIDIGALQLQNEKVKAVGNMGVNARGEKVDAKNKAIQSRNASMAKHYEKQTSSNVVDEVPVSKAPPKKPKQPEPQPEPVVEAVVESPAPVGADDPLTDLATSITNKKDDGFSLT